MNLNESISQQFDALIRGLDIALLHLRMVYVHDRKKFEHTAQDVLRSYPKGMIQYITIFDKNGNQFFLSNNTKHVVNIADREHFTFHKQKERDELFISHAFFARVTQKPMVQVNRKLHRNQEF